MEANYFAFHFLHIKNDYSVETMKRYSYNTLSDDDLNKLCRRPKMDFKSIFGTVEPIVDRIGREGDAGIRHFTEKFDSVSPDPQVIQPEEMDVKLDDETKQAIDTAFNNIYRFHKAQLPMPLEVETMPGVQCKRVDRLI